MNISKTVRYFASFCLIAFVLTACGKKDANTLLNEQLQHTWNVKTITEDGLDIFASQFTAQSYTFDQDEDFGGEGDVTVVSAPVGGPTAITEEFYYIISNSGKRISWDATARNIQVVDSTLTINFSNKVITAIREE